MIENLDPKTKEFIEKEIGVEGFNRLLELIKKEAPELEDPEVFLDEGFIEVVYKGGTWEQWKTLVKKVKKQLREEGYSQTARKVAIVLLGGLTN